MTDNEYQNKMLKLYDIVIKHIELYRYIYYNDDKGDVRKLFEHIREIHQLAYIWYFLVDVSLDTSTDKTYLIVTCNRYNLSIADFAKQSFREYLEKTLDCKCVATQHDGQNVIYTFNPYKTKIPKILDSELNKLINDSKLLLTTYYKETLEALEMKR